MALDPDALLARYTRIRATSERLCEPLFPDDLVVQPVEFVSPPKWHLGQTTRFIEEHVVAPHVADYAPFDPLFDWVFAPHETLGHRTQRRLRGSLARPPLERIRQYRAHIDELFAKILSKLAPREIAEFERRTEIALQHELVHQEAMMADIKYILFTTPGLPEYRQHRPAVSIKPGEGEAKFISGGMHRVGFEGTSFSFDDERPAHMVDLKSFRLHCFPVTNGDYLEFVEQNGYQTRQWWSDAGWQAAQREKWHAPLYWLNLDGAWWEFRLDGLRPIDLVAPVCHVSYYEAEAYAKWARKRLPTEEEWEVATQLCEDLGEGNFLESGTLHPSPGTTDIPSHRLLGDVWEWTASAHLPYPGYVGDDTAHTAAITVFGNDWQVLRGGSCLSPRESVRITKRNALRPEMRWYCTGIRLAEDG